MTGTTVTNTEMEKVLKMLMKMAISTSANGPCGDIVLVTYRIS